MTSLGQVFDPIDLDYGHVSNVILRTVQSSLVPRIQSGRGDATLVPKFVRKKRVESYWWLYYSLEIKGSYPGKIPKSVVAIIYDKQSKARKLLMDNTKAVRDILDWVAPRIYGTSFEGDSKSYNVVIMEDVETTGVPLDELWWNLNDDQKKAVLDKIADILTVPVHIPPPEGMQFRPPRAFGIGTAGASSSSAASRESTARYPLPSTNLEFLHKCYNVIHLGLFNPNGEPNLLAFRQRFQGFDTYELSPQDVLRVKNLDALLHEHLPSFAGGNFLPPHITGRNKESFKNQKEKDKFTERKLVMQTILSESLFRLSHKEMTLSNFFVSFEADGTTVKSIVLTQWDKAYYGPLWTTTLLPFWLEPLSPEHRNQSATLPANEIKMWREYLVYNSMMKKERLPRSWLWFVAYVYGELERHFAMILTSTWNYNSMTEPWLKELVQDAAKKETTAYKKGVDPVPLVPFSGKIETMDVNFAEIMGKWMPYARAFVEEQGFLRLSKS